MNIGDARKERGKRMDFQEPYHRHYITTDSQARILGGWSDGPSLERDAADAICINKGNQSMQVTVSANTVITAAALVTALGSLLGIIIWWVKFIERDKRQDKELKAILKEQTLICFGVLACLKGLKEQGCNGPVTAALDKLEKHLNQAAHEEDA